MMKPLTVDRCRCFTATLLGSALILLSLIPDPAQAASTANQLTYLDQEELFYPGLSFPKLTTPQWVGEEGVEAVVVLAIDDMRDSTKYETYLRPILDRLKRIDGRAPVSIMANAIDPSDPQLASWVKEGLSLEVHTLAHPCPCLQKGNFVAAANTYHGCVDLLNRVPGNEPVAFRMPCCDSMNSPSPRFYAEVFRGTNAAGQFLSIDSSIMNITTSQDPSLPRAWVLDEDGRERFGKYLPRETSEQIKVAMGSFVTTIENYPYPYVMSHALWEFPCALPSDWEAQNLHGVNQPKTVEDWKVALDITVRKQGVFNLIFHPHGWIRPEQIVELVDHAVERHGGKVKFLTFREAQDRLTRHLLAGQGLRSSNGADNGVRLLDLNFDGYQDVIIGNEDRRLTRIWNPAARHWMESDFPVTMDGCRFGVIGGDSRSVVLLKTTEEARGAWRFSGQAWIEEDRWLQGLVVEGQPVLTLREGKDGGVRWRDIDLDGSSELIVSHPEQHAIFAWSDQESTWQRQPFDLPADTTLVDAAGRDRGLRFVDINEDGYEDVLFSNAERCSLHLYVPVANQRLMWQVGWNDEVFAGRRDEGAPDIPMIVRDGPHPNNGVWFARSTMWIQNEDTAHLPDQVDRRSFADLLQADTPPPMTPEESLAAMHARPGFKVELVAAEPLLADPVAFDWSADGRLWVVGMEDYPLGIGEEGKPGGTVRILEDLDRDGRYDRSTLFLDELWYPSGIMAWRDGVIVASAPDVFYAEDTDGDGRADRREVLLTGFSRGNPQHLVNGFEYGLDHWVYGANGDSGGRITSQRASDRAPLNLQGRDFRFRPESGELELIAGQTQFGRHRDDWGHWFGNNNPTWLWHYNLPEHYLQRNPHLIVSETRHVLARYEGSGRVFPASRTRQRFNDHHHFNHVTSANSAAPYRDDLFGEEYASSVFISDPVHNVVHREVLTAVGATFTSRRAEDESDIEFLASEDNWFRPAMTKTGPDGALYVADFHRLILEHPQWIPDFMESRLQLRAGEKQGRLYRVYPEGKLPRAIPDLAALDTPSLVAALDSPNGWQRDTVQRILVTERNDHPAEADLRSMAHGARLAAARVQALCTLQGRSELTTDVLRDALGDAHPMVRVHALRLWESFDFDSALARLANDPDFRVRRQLAFSLGSWSERAAAETLAELALRDGGVEEMRVAVLSSALGHYRTMMQALLRDTTDHEKAAPIMQELLVLAVDEGDRSSLADVLESVLNTFPDAASAWQYRTLGALLKACDRRELEAAAFGNDISRRLARFIENAEALTQQSSASVSEKVAALEVLFWKSSGVSSHPAVLGNLLQSSEPVEIQEAALQAAQRLPEDETADLLMAAWRQASPARREEVLSALLSRANWVHRFFDRMADGSISAGQLGIAHRQRLLSHRDKRVRERAASLLTGADTDRQRVLQKYAALDRWDGDAERGLVLFRDNCAMCHRYRGEGTELGPDLGAVTDKTEAALLTAILDPNQAVEWRYVTYDVLTADDRELTGLVVAETPNSITLRSVGGTETTLARNRLKRFESGKLSLMPEGLEAVLPPPAMADLLAFLGARSSSPSGQ